MAGPSSGTEIVIGKFFVARRVWVQSEAVRERRSGALDRKLEVSAGASLCREADSLAEFTFGHGRNNTTGKRQHLRRLWFGDSFRHMGQ